MYTQKLSDKKQRISLIRNHVTHIYICIYGPKSDFKIFPAFLTICLASKISKNARYFGPYDGIFQL